MKGNKLTGHEGMLSTEKTLKPLVGDSWKQVRDIVVNGESKSRRMVELYNLEIDYKVIARIMDTSTNFVYNVISRTYGEVRTRGRGETKKAIILELFKQGKSLSEISRETGTIYNYVWQVIRNSEKQEK